MTSYFDRTFSNFKKVYIENQVSTFIDEKGEEKKKKVKLPFKWTNDKFDFDNQINRNYGCAIRTGKINNITVVDIDNMNTFKEICKICPDILKYYHVKTLKGFHFYFNYVPELKKNGTNIWDKFEGVDIRTDGGCAYYLNNVHRYNYDPNNKETYYSYIYEGGKLMDMPKCIFDICVSKLSEEDFMNSSYEKPIKYDNIHLTDEDVSEVIDKLIEKYPTYLINYDTWLTFTSVMKWCDKYHLWEEYSKENCNTKYIKGSNDITWKSCKPIWINYFCKLLKIPFKKFFSPLYNNEITKFKDELLNKIEINTPYMNVPNKALKNDIIIMESDPGTGKSTCTAKLYKNYLDKNYFENYKVLSIVSLIKLADQQVLTFRKNGINLISYRTEDDKFLNPSILLSDHAVICINSLWKLSDFDFSKHILYIDEIHALLNSITHNETIKYQRLVYNTLSYIINTCHKVIVSDAHIFDSVIKLLMVNSDETRNIMYFKNTYKRFQGVKAIKYDEEDKFYNKMLYDIQNNRPFSFASESKKIVTEYYNCLMKEAPAHVIQNMLLFTADTSEEIVEDWTGKFIFYSPKITCGVDITILTQQTTQYVYINGKSIDSISLLQMSTRTRNMNEMHYIDFSVCQRSNYTTLEDCKDCLIDTFKKNKIGILPFMNEKLTINDNMFFSVYTLNTYVKDKHKTNIGYYFEQELINCGFDIGLESITIEDEVIDNKDELNKKTEHLNKEIANEMKIVSEEIKDEKFNLLVSYIEDKSENKIPNNAIKKMVERVELLKLNTSELVEEYREVIEDENIFDFFMNFTRLHRSFEYCEDKLKQIVSNKMGFGLERNVWNKIKYIHMLSKHLKINNLFALHEIKEPEKTDELENIILSVKKLYDKRDSLTFAKYKLKDYIKLYKFLIDKVIDGLSLFSSKRSNKRDETRSLTIYSVKQDVYDRYKKLMDIFNPPCDANNVNYLLDDDDN